MDPRDVPPRAHPAVDSGALTVSVINRPSAVASIVVNVDQSTAVQFIALSVHL